MKQVILFGVCLSFALTGNSQNTTPTPFKQVSIPASIANQAVRTSTRELIEQATLPAQSTAAAKKAAPNNPTANSMLPTPVIIGSTVYQLQTNASTRNALVKNADGSVSAVWTISPTDPATDRGTGYAYFNGSTWAANPAGRIETTRTGWPSVATTGTGKEIIINHNTAVSQLELITRAAKGTGSWTESTNTLNGPSQGGNVWPRIAIGGANNNIVHVISLTAPTGLSGKKYNKQNGAMTYSRSQDGVTWDKKNVLLGTALDSANGGFNFFEGDGYALDARGTNVAFVAGSSVTDLVLMKSTDSGTNWTKTKILTFPFKNFNGQVTDTNNDAVADTLTTNDGSMAILLDNNNMAHVWFGNMRVLNLTLNDSGSYLYFPGTAGIMYWNESMGATPPVFIAGLIDYDMSGVIEFPTPATGGRPYGTYGCSLTSHPSAGIDANGYIYLAYDAIIENTVDKTNSKAIRNVMAMGTKDGGATWSSPVQVSPDPSFEQVYPSAARYVNTCFSMIYQNDDAAGHGVNSGTTTNVDNAPNLGVSADIYYLCMNTSEINSVKEHAEQITSSSNYPNPFNGKTYVDITLKKASNLSVEVFNTMGQKVLATDNKYLSAGTQTITIDATNLKAGVYFYTLKTADASITNKIVIQ
jgi:hypothetical protein